MIALILIYTLYVALRLIKAGVNISKMKMTYNTETKVFSYPSPTDRFTYTFSVKSIKCAKKFVNHELDLAEITITYYEENKKGIRRKLTTISLSLIPDDHLKMLSLLEKLSIPIYNSQEDGN